MITVGELSLGTQKAKIGLISDRDDEVRDKRITYKKKAQTIQYKSSIFLQHVASAIVAVKAQTLHTRWLICIVQCAQQHHLTGVLHMLHTFIHHPMMDHLTTHRVMTPPSSSPMLVGRKAVLHSLAAVTVSTVLSRPATAAPSQALEVHLRW